MTTFETDSLVETVNAPWFWPLLIICVVLAIVAFSLSVAEDSGWWFSFGLLMTVATFTVLFTHTGLREEQTIEMGQVLEAELQEAGFSDADVGYVNNTKTGDGVEFQYAKDNEILECKLIAGPEHGVFKVVCW